MQAQRLPQDRDISRGQRVVILHATRRGLKGALYAFQQAFREFLLVPSLVIVGFGFLAGFMYAIDRSQIPFLQPLSHALQHYLLSSPSATDNLLGTVSAGIITVTSITFSLLLLAIQQSATSLTSQVYDQLLRRTLNQLYLGYFVGLALYSLFTMASVNKPHNPVLGATVDLFLTLVGLYFLIVLLYDTIEQIRPSQVIESIHDLTLAARRSQERLVQSTRRSSESSCRVRVTVQAGGYGYLTAIHLGKLEQALGETQDECEVVILVPIGAFVPFRGPDAEVKAATEADAAILGEAVPKALQLSAGRHIQGDPAYGIEQLVTIAWTSESTSKQNLAPGARTVHLLHDLLAHWSEHQEHQDYQRLAIVYPDDILPKLLDAFEELATIAAKALQYAVFAEILHAISESFASLPSPIQRRMEGMILRLLSSVGDLPLSEQLNEALCHLAEVLRAAGRDSAAGKVEKATNELAKTFGRLSSRSTRVQNSGG